MVFFFRVVDFRVAYCAWLIFVRFFLLIGVMHKRGLCGGFFVRFIFVCVLHAFFSSGFIFAWLVFLWLIFELLVFCMNGVCVVDCL